jgi:hypothetical protein
MSSEPRTIDECPFRRIVREEKDTEVAYCSLLERIAGVESCRLSIVGRDACRACCESFSPAPEHINPTIASLLYGFSSQVLRQGGVPGCDTARAQELNRLAVANLPGEEDCVEVPLALSSGIGAISADSIDKIVPIPRRRSGPPILTWSTAVTTAPRGVPTLKECLDSLTHAGWERPRLFVDGEVDIPAAYRDLPRTHRDPCIGAWPNYYLALVELLMREPSADAYLLVQDDGLFVQSPELRRYLERVLWPGDLPGIASLYCSRAYVQPRRGWHLFHGAWVWSALAFVFSRDAAKRFVADRDVVEHRWNRGAERLADIDWLIGQWAVRAGVPVYFPTPSLVQHIGHVSSLWSDTRAFGNRRATWFAGGEFKAP